MHVRTFTAIPISITGFLRHTSYLAVSIYRYRVYRPGTTMIQYVDRLIIDRHHLYKEIIS